MRSRPPGVSVHLTGGLGNQLFQLAAALRAADGGLVILEFGLMTVRTSETGEPDICQYVLPRNVRIERFNARSLRGWVMKFLNLALFSLSSSLPRNRRHSFFRRPARSLFSFIMGQVSTPKAEVIASSNSGYDHRIEEPIMPGRVVGYFQTYMYASHTQTQRALDHLRPIVDTPWVSKMEVYAARRQPIVIHLRLGDYRLERSFGIPGPDYYRKALLYLLEKDVAGPLWLFSDEPEKALSWMPQEVLALNPYLVRPPLSASAVDILEVMRLGKAFVLGNSTYGYWAAMLSGCREDLVTIPRPWFRDIEEFEKFSPTAWAAFDAAYA